MEYKSPTDSNKQNKKYVQLGNKFYITDSDNIDGITTSEVCWRKHHKKCSLCFRELGLTPERFLIELWQAADSDTTTPFDAAEFGLELKVLSKHRKYCKPPSLIDAKFACLEFSDNGTIIIPFWFGKEIYVDISNIQDKMDIGYCLYDNLNGENAMRTLLERLTRKVYFRDNISHKIVAGRNRWIAKVDKRCEMTGEKLFVFLPYTCRPRNFTVLESLQSENTNPQFLIYEDFTSQFSIPHEDLLVIRDAIENIHTLQDQLLAASNSFLRKR
jgi:hypothetical protein